MLNVAVLGAGSWGTALSQHLATNGVVVKLWGRDKNQLKEIQKDRENKKYLPQIKLSENIHAEEELENAVKDVSAVILCLPSSATRLVLEQLKEFYPDLKKLPPILSTAKGLEKNTNRRTSEIVEQVFSQEVPHFVLSGPSFAAEVAKGLPTAVVLAKGSKNFHEQFDFCARLFHRGTMRVYTSTDLIGVELGGVLKNIIAIAAGVSDGLNLGLNARAALLTRGLREITRLIEVEGGQKDTVVGLSGLGDLMLTATGDLSRNRSFGILLGQGNSIDDSIKKIGQTIEALTTAESALELAIKKNIEVPIIEQVAGILSNKTTPIKALQDLMTREQKPELA